MQRRTPIFFVASPRPRVGKTLLARVLADYFRADGHTIACFDVNPDEFALVDHLPAFTAVASVNDTKDQMGLFDQLVVGDEVPKIVDIGHGVFERFFNVMQEIDFSYEAKRRSVAPVVLFIADPDRRSQQAYAMLRHRFADLALVPVLNEAVPHVARYRDNFPPTPAGGPPLSIPALAAVIKSVIERPGFSFASYSAKASDTTTELYGWIRHVFLEFRELELRLLLEELKPELKFSA
jgi:hypothetical protein